MTTSAVHHSQDIEELGKVETAARMNQSHIKRASFNLSVQETLEVSGIDRSNRDADMDFTNIFTEIPRRPRLHRLLSIPPYLGGFGLSLKKPSNPEVIRTDKDVCLVLGVKKKSLLVQDNPF